jgi:hypothetical protein
LAGTAVESAKQHLNFIVMSKKNKKDYDSTTSEPFKPEKTKPQPLEDPDKTKKTEKNDPTRESNPDITSTPDNANRSG